MWNSYFFQIQSKYSMRVSFKNPLVIRLDGKDVTKNKKYDLLNNYEGNFRNTLEKTAEFFTRKYKCLAILGSDEISFIFTDPLVVISDLDKEKWNTSNEIISVFSQYFFDYFNEHNKQSKVFWHGKCFSIRNEKINSYIKFRSSIIKNVMTTYFLSKYNIKMGKEKQENNQRIWATTILACATGLCAASTRRPEQARQCVLLCITHGNRHTRQIGAKGIDIFSSCGVMRTWRPHRR